MKVHGDAIFLKVLVPVASGTGLGLHFSGGAFPVHFVYISSAVFFILLLAFHFYYRRYRLYLCRWIPGVLTHAVLLTVSFSLTLSRFPLAGSDHFSKSGAEALVVRVSADPKVTENTVTAETEVEQGILGERFIPLSGRLLLTVRKEHKDFMLRPGERLLIPARFNEITPPLNPNEFDYKGYLENRGFFHRAFFSTDRLVILKHHNKPVFQDYILRLRRTVVERFYRHIRNEEAAAVASTLILGYKAALSQDVLTAYAKTGAMHVLSVSGMHVALVMTLLSYLLWFMRGNARGRILQSLLIIAVVWFYAILTGLSAAACRASMMISFVIAARMIRRDHQVSNSVSASAVILLLYDPSFLADIGFQLSFLAVFGLVYLYPLFYSLFKFRNKLLEWLWVCISVSLSAQLATFPLCLYYFNQFPLYFFVSNIFVSVPVTLIMYAGIVFMLIPAGPVSGILGAVLRETILFLDSGLRFIEKLPYASIHGVKFGLCYYLLMYLGLILIFFAVLRHSKKFLYTASFVIFLLICVNAGETILSSGKKSILFYSLRKGFAIGFFNGAQGYVTTDLDPPGKAFSYSVQPVLVSRNLQLKSILDTDRSIGDGSLFSDGHFYQFEGKRILIYDKYFNDRDFSSSIQVDYLLITGNPTVKLAKSGRFIHSRYLLIGGDNSDYHIRQWKKEAESMKMPFYILKERPAFEFPLR